jgi:predicted P-loop ATPase
MMAVWLRAVVAQWLGVDDNHANAVMLLLVSPRQGLHKSSFLHALLPDELESYYTDDFTLTSKGNAERKLVEFALLNIDEFDKLPAKKMPDLKTLMQTLRPSFVKAYKTNFNQLPRIASFVGTSNSRQLLTDRSGSRRFLILEPDGMIDIEGIDHRQLFAQLLHEVEHGGRYHFTKDEEEEMQRVNQRYYKPTPEEQLFARFFRAATEADEAADSTGTEKTADSTGTETVANGTGAETVANGTVRVECLSAGQLMARLSKHSPSLMRNMSETVFGKMLTRMGIPREHHHSGNLYRVVAL